MRLLAVMLLLLASVSCRQQVTQIPIQKAILQLPTLMPNDPMALNGEWLFFPGELLDPDSVKDDQWPTLLAKGSLVKLPGQWNQWPDPQHPDATLPAFGYGTFVLRIQGLDRWSNYALGMPPILTASRTYLKANFRVHADLLAAQGTVATDPEHFVPFEQQQVIAFSLPVPVAYLIIQVSNFQLRKGGIPNPILIGNHGQLARAEKITYGLNLWLFGMMLAISAYNVFLFINRPEDYSSLSLAFFSLVIASRLITTENFLELWVAYPSWLLTEIRYKIEYASIILCPIAISIFLFLNFPKRYSKTYIKITAVICILQVLPVLALSSRLYTPYLLVFQILLFGSGVYAFFCGIKVLWHRDPEWQYLAIGGYPFFFAIVTDILVSRNLLQITYTVQYVMVWFTMTQSHILGKRFAAAFRTAKHLSEHLQNEVEQQTAEIAAHSRSMKAILDNVPVGVFTLSNASLAIDQEYSLHMEKIFRTKRVAQCRVTEFLLQDSMLDADEIEQIEQILLASIKEAELNFTLNEQTLCRELVKRIDGTETILSISWVPITDGHGIVQKLLVTVHDVSEIRKLTQESQERNNHLNRIAEIIQAGKDRMQHTLLSTRRLLNESQVLATETVTEDAIKTIFINLHTIKGNGRQLHLRQLTESAHHCEKYLHELRKQPGLWQKPLLDAYLKDLAAIVLSYEEQLRELELQSHLEVIVQEQGPSIIPLLQKSWQQRALPVRDVEALSTYAAATLGIDLQQVLENAFSGIDTLARDLGKAEPLVLIRSDPVIVTRSAQEFLQNILVHVLRNCMDHGVEDPVERQKIGKPPRGKIQLTATVVGHSLRLHLEDDGRGLDIGRLRKILPQSNGSIHDIALRIFDAGVSTAQAVTEISGRGVGMAAIKRHIEEAGGAVELVLGEQNKLGFCPFGIAFSLPESCILWAESAVAAIQPVAS